MTRARKSKEPATRSPAVPRFRFDKVATRVVERLRARLGGTVPEGMTVLFTITAPIRLPAKTAALLEQKVRTLLEQGWTGRDEADDVHGNGVVIRVLKDGGKAMPKMIGFVHNPESDAVGILDMTRELLEALLAG